MPDDNCVFVIDPDPILGGKLTALLAEHDVGVRTFASAEEFLQAHPTGCEGIGCLLIDAQLPGISGLTLLQQIRARGFTQPLIFLVETADRESRRQAMAASATVVIAKAVVKAFLAARLEVLEPGRNYCSGPPAKGFELRDGTLVTFRMMQPDDADIMQQFVRAMSARSSRLRFFSRLDELSPTMLEQFTNPQYPHTYAIMAIISEAGREQQIADVRYEKTDTDGVVEFAITVADAWHGFGLASEMLRGIIAVAAVAGIDRLQASVLEENYRMLTLAEALGFTVSDGEEDSSVVCVAKQLRDC